MNRSILFSLLLFFVPFAVYFGLLTWMNRRGITVRTSWAWPVIAGVVLVLVALAASLSLTGAPAGSRYTAPQIVDGHLVGSEFHAP